MSENSMDQNAGYAPWSDLQLRRQFWYLTQRIRYHENTGTEALHKERNELLDYIYNHRRFPVGPMSKKGCEDLLGDGR